MEERLIIERIEDAVALGELHGQAVEVPLALLPHDVKVGDVLLNSAEGWVPDPEETARRRELAAQRYRKLFGPFKRD
jgi:hypothetical protein